MRRPAERPVLGLYVHIPFCKAKCAYCDFYSLAHSEEKMDAYTAALVRHLEEVAPRAAGMQVDTVYFGGGTPSYLGVSRLTRLLQTVLRRYDVARGAEITLETNPDSAGDWRELRKLRRAGFNRLSLGVQSTDDALLRRIGRVHTYEQVQQAVTAARKAKIENLSLDLIYGLPDYAQESFPPYDISYAGGRPLFVTVGSFEPRKGQDIFCNAIRLLKPEVRQKAAFLFVGKAADKSLKNAVDALVEDYPDTVFYRKRLERPEIKSLLGLRDPKAPKEEN